MFLTYLSHFKRGQRNNPYFTPSTSIVHPLQNLKEVLDSNAAWRKDDGLRDVAFPGLPNMETTACGWRVLPDSPGHWGPLYWSTLSKRDEGR